jgi:hypothetical protein
MSEFLDELARRLAEPMSRRRAVKVAAGAAAAAAVPGMRVRPARGALLISQRTTCTPRPGGKLCACPSVNGLFYKQCCPAPASDWDCQCKAPPGGYAACAPHKCGSGHQCGGGECCKPGQYCVNPDIHLCCDSGTSGCGTTCCKKNEECVVTRVGTSSIHTCVPRCPPNQARCGPTKCCPKNWRCANQATGLCKRCPYGWSECNKKCCEPSSQCCGTAGCCPKDRACCSTGTGSQICCPSGEKCATEIQPGDIGVLPGAASICCPPERYNADVDVCCPPGETALSGPGLKVGPGLKAFCCPEAQQCGSTCCQTSAILGSESCCDGTCVDTSSSVTNCGACGHACAPGTVCKDGQCALVSG